jgi:hypothetical protein
MLRLYRESQHIIYGKCYDGHGYRALFYSTYYNYCERMIQITGIVRCIGGVKNILNGKNELIILYIDDKYQIKRCVYQMDKIENKYIACLTFDDQHWCDLSPTTLSLIRQKNDIRDWQAYIDSFAQAWNTFPAYIARRMQRKN